MIKLKQILITLLLLPFTVFADDSEVFLDVTGDDADIMIEQQDTDNLMCEDHVSTVSK